MKKFIEYFDLEDEPILFVGIVIGVLFALSVIGLIIRLIFCAC